MKSIDFLIIGAQKAGTTTLFNLLSEHPSIYMPKAKELPFFTDDILYEKGIDSFMNKFFSSAPSEALIGTATPHYLSDPRAAERIAKSLPNIKLIAILRDPVERALSHYRMSLRRGIEIRSFEHAIADALDTNELNDARKLNMGIMSENKTYIAWGEYGRLLEKYFHFFSSNQILILYTSDLEIAPMETLNKIWHFLDIPTMQPKSIGKKFHVGGAKQRISLNIVKKIPGIRKIWRSLPINFTNWTLFSLNQINIVKSVSSIEEQDAETIKKLKHHFNDDKNLLEKITKMKTPWLNDLDEY